MPNEENRTRLFDLPRFEPPGDSHGAKLAWLEALANEITMSPDEDIVDSESTDHPELPAGYTYFGQFLVHDLTFLVQHPMPKEVPPGMLGRRPDAMPDAGAHPEPARRRWSNMRTPCLDLDSIYDGGPRVAPELYDRDQRAKLLLGGRAPDGARWPQFEGDDLMRTPQGRAVIPDPRNDENPMVSQMHVAFVKAHNALVDQQLAGGATHEAAFSNAQRTLRWSFQWVVLRDFLPRVLDRDRCQVLTMKLARAADGAPITLHHYPVEAEPFIPIEFAHAAMRFGHSIVRPRYVLNGGLGPIAITPNDWLAPPHTYLHMFRPLPDGWKVDWQLFLCPDRMRYPNLPTLPPKYLAPEYAHLRPQHARSIDDKITERLAHLPQEFGNDPRVSSLPFLTLLAGYLSGVPSGHAVATAMGFTPVTRADEPLWTYILREARIVEGGKRLGPVGSTLVMEVILGLIAQDPSSYVSVDPQWRPELARDGGSFELFDLLMLGCAAPRGSRRRRAAPGSERPIRTGEHPPIA